MSAQSTRTSSSDTTQKKAFDLELWSDPIHPSFSVTFFVDTNILAYLVDCTFPSLTEFINQAKECKFIELVSSKYVIFEFVGIRKKEHYLRKIAASSIKTAQGEINFSSLLKYTNQFSAPEAPFENVIADIKKSVENELETIARDYKINYEYSQLHDDQLKPTFEICLSTKIANQDSLVLISSVLPQPKTTSEHLQLLTNDSDFADSFEKADVDYVFETNKIAKPKVHLIKKISGENNSVINLNEAVSPSIISESIKNIVLQIIQEKNSTLYLGKTFTAINKDFPTDVVCFKLNLDTQAPENVYLTIVSRNLDFIYSSKNRIDFLWHNNKKLTKGSTLQEEGKNNVAFKIIETNESGEVIQISESIINAIRANGNLVFIHPDSEL